MPIQSSTQISTRWKSLIQPCFTANISCALIWNFLLQNWKRLKIGRGRVESYAMSIRSLQVSWPVRLIWVYCAHSQLKLLKTASRISLSHQIFLSQWHNIFSGFLSPPCSPISINAALLSAIRVIESLLLLNDFLVKSYSHMHTGKKGAWKARLDPTHKRNLQVHLVCLTILVVFCFQEIEWARGLINRFIWNKLIQQKSNYFSISRRLREVGLKSVMIHFKRSFFPSLSIFHLDFNSI